MKRVARLTFYITPNRMSEFPSASVSASLRESSSQADGDVNRLFSHSLDLLCIAGLDGYFKRVNPAWTRVLGWSEDELMSRPVADFVHPDDRERTLVARQNLAAGQPLRALENRYLCKDGSYRWLSWQSTVEPGKATVFGVARDITERRRADQEQLVLSKLESTGVLAGGIAHDFNNLLSTLLLNVEMVSLSGEVSELQRRYLTQAEQTLHAAKVLTQQLIVFAHNGVPARRVIDLKELLVQSLEVALRGSRVRGQATLPPDLWTAEVNETQLGQVIRNLVLNAREALVEGGAVSLQATNVTLEGGSSGLDLPSGPYVRIIVADNGRGIEPEVMPKIFDPYFTTKQRGAEKGMGLGLTICRSVLQKHGGGITVDSAPGRGTTVTCYLPAVRKAPPAGTKSEPQGAALRVLVMDDEKPLREIMGLTLSQLGYRVDVAQHGEEAVKLYAQAMDEGRPYAVVLLDLTVRGGLGAAETMPLLRARDPKVNAILMTGYANDGIFSDYASHGFKQAVSKPFARETLRRAINATLATSG